MSGWFDRWNEDARGVLEAAYRSPQSMERGYTTRRDVGAVLQARLGLGQDLTELADLTVAEDRCSARHRGGEVYLSDEVKGIVAGLHDAGASGKVVTLQLLQTALVQSLKDEGR